MSAVIPSERIQQVSGYGMSVMSDGYVFRPTSVDEIRNAFAIARANGRQVVLRGAGRSYGDAAILPESVVVDMCRMRRVLSWDSKTGRMEVESGATIEDLWRLGIEDGWWPPVVSGTMFPTLAGALGMNIHGKNNPQAGTLGEHVLELDVLFSTGELRTLTPQDDLFYAVISSFGQLGAITRVVLQMKKLHSGNLRVLPLTCANWDEHFEVFDRFEGNCDYLVSWVDCFGKGKSFGRGQIHVGWYTDEEGDPPSSLKLDRQDLPDTIMGLLPKSMVWRFLKPFNNRTGMHFINWAKQMSSSILGDGRPYVQSLVAFSFLLDYVPNWRNAYLPGGFIQYQSFVPRAQAPEVFARQVELQQEAKLESFLGVMKRHRPDKFLFSHAVNGYSLALDFKLTTKNRERLWELAHQMNDLVVEAGGRFYLAKDSTLRPIDVRAYLGDATISRFLDFKKELDPENLLSSSLMKRIGIIPSK